jgi:hypothetical protein
MMDAVQQAARLLSPALFRRGRIMVAPPSAHNSCWRVFGGSLSAEVCEHEAGVMCSFVLRGPDGKTLRQGVAGTLASALRRATDLLCQFYIATLPPESPHQSLTEI